MPVNDTLSVEDKLIAYLGEVPSRDAAIVALVCYAVVTVSMLVMTIKTRGWFMMTAVVTGALELLGFVARVLLIQTAARNALVMMQCLLIISPVLLAIVEYVCVGKLISKSEAGRATTWLRWQVYAFTASDIFTLSLQGAGGAMLAQADTNPNAAEKGRMLLLIGLALQLVFFGSFIFVTVYIHMVPRFGYKGNRQYARIFHCLYATIALLYVRNVFRVIEFAQGWRGYLATHEVYFYVFDFIPILLTFVLFSIWHYSLYLNPGENVSPCEPASPKDSSRSSFPDVEKGAITNKSSDTDTDSKAADFGSKAAGGVAVTAVVSYAPAPVHASAAGVQMVSVSPAPAWQ